MLDFVSGNDPYVWKGYFLAVVFLVINVVNAGIVHVFFKYSYLTAMRIRTAITTAVYRKVRTNSLVATGESRLIRTNNAR